MIRMFLPEFNIQNYNEGIFAEFNIQNYNEGIFAKFNMRNVKTKSKS